MAIPCVSILIALKVFIGFDSLVNGGKDCFQEDKYQETRGIISQISHSMGGVKKYYRLDTNDPKLSSELRGVTLKLQRTLLELQSAIELLRKRIWNIQANILNLISSASDSLHRSFWIITPASTTVPDLGNSHDRVSLSSCGLKAQKLDGEANMYVRHMQTYESDQRIGAGGFQYPCAVLIGQEKLSWIYRPYFGIWHREPSKFTYLPAMLVAGPFIQWGLLLSLQLEPRTPFDEMVLRNLHFLDSCIRAASPHHTAAMMLLCLSTSLNVIGIVYTIVRASDNAKSSALSCCWSLLIFGALSRNYVGCSIFEYFLVFMPFFLGFGVGIGILSHHAWTCGRQWRRKCKQCVLEDAREKCSWYVLTSENKVQSLLIERGVYLLVPTLSALVRNSYANRS